MAVEATMKRSVGWTVTASGRARVPTVASRTLRARLAAVWSELRASCRSRHTPERVHQVRVASRRALAAFKAFHDVVPRKHGRWFCKWLRRIRRAAGETRDLDVLLARWVNETASPADGCDERRILALLRRRRDGSRHPLRRVRERLERDGWSQRVERLLARTAAADNAAVFRAYARQGLKPWVRRFFTRADRPLEDADELHRLRIEGKKLRYALEIFAIGFSRRTRSVCLRALEEIQASLGEFMDHAAAADRLRRWARETGVGPDRKTLVELCKREETLADEAREAFAAWWTPSRRRMLRRCFSHTMRGKPR